MMPLFDRYGEWPEEPLANLDPNAPAPRQDVTRVITHHSGVGTTMVLDSVDALELARAAAFG
jgi:hypothetical protein